MQSDQNFYARKAVVPPLAYEAGGYSFNIPVAPRSDPTLIGAKHVVPFHGVELQASEVCPKNFIIFDHTDNKSRIMFHPALAHKLNCPSFDIRTTYPQQTGVIRDQNDEDDEEVPSSYKEDSKDIDALLSLDEEEEEDEDEEVSTGRAPGNRGSKSPDSCSTNGTKSGKSRLSPIRKSLSGGASSSSSSTSERKKQKMKEMMKVLRGIVPGGDGMESAAILDEAVKYLKSLKVEVKKLGLANFKN